MKKLIAYLLVLCSLILVYFIYMNIRTLKESTITYNNTTIQTILDKGLSKKEIEELPSSLIKFISSNDSILELVEHTSKDINNVKLGNLVFKSINYYDNEKYYLITYFSNDKNYLSISENKILMKWNKEYFTIISSTLHVEGYNYMGAKKSFYKILLDFSKDEYRGFILPKLFKSEGYCWVKVYNWTDKKESIDFNSIYD